MWMDSRGLFLNTTQTSRNHNYLVSRHIKNTFWQNGSYSKSLVANVPHLLYSGMAFQICAVDFVCVIFSQISDRSVSKSGPEPTKQNGNAPRKTPASRALSLDMLCVKTRPLCEQTCLSMSFNCNFSVFEQGFTGTLKECVTHRGPKLLFFFFQSNSSSATRQDEDQEVRQKLLGREPWVSVFWLPKISGVAVITTYSSWAQSREEQQSSRYPKIIVQCWRTIPTCLQDCIHPQWKENDASRCRWSVVFCFSMVRVSSGQIFQQLSDYCGTPKRATVKAGVAWVDLGKEHNPPHFKLGYVSSLEP